MGSRGGDRQYIGASWGGSWGKRDEKFFAETCRGQVACWQIQD